LGAVTFNGTLTAFNGYGSTVNLSCGTGAPPTCTSSPASVTPTPGGAVFTVSASSNLGQNYSFDIVGQGTDSSATLHSYRVTLSSIFDFNITNSSGAPKPPKLVSLQLTIWTRRLWAATFRT